MSLAWGCILRVLLTIGIFLFAGQAAACPWWAFGPGENSPLRNASRVESLLKKMGEPETSPLLQAVLPEAYQSGYSPPVLKEALDEFISVHGGAGDLLSEFFGQLTSVSATQRYLLQSPAFAEFVQREGTQEDRALLTNPQLHAFFEKENFSEFRQDLSTIYPNGIIAHSSDAEIAEGDRTARELLAKTGVGTDIVRVAGLVERYRAYLDQFGEWDPALGSHGPRGTGYGDDAADPYFPENFLGKSLRIGGTKWEIFEKIGSGGENFVFRARDVLTGEMKVLKITGPRSFVNPEPVHVLQKKIHDAGIPVVQVDNLGPNFNFVEEIKTFGSDTASRFIETGSAEDLPSLIDFYKDLLADSTLRLQDIKPDNVGRRADGQWVVTDWAFNLYWGQQGQPLEGKVDPVELGAQVSRGAWAAFKSAVLENPDQKALYGKRALALAKRMMDEVGCQAPEAYEELEGDIQRIVDASDLGWLRP